jgi:hypothetical protein
MNVRPMQFEIGFVSNSTIREASLPNLFFSAELSPEPMRVPALDQLDRTLQGLGGRHQ